MDVKRLFVYAIVIAALMLAGCGGNGGTQTMGTMDPPSGPSVGQQLTDAKGAASTAARLAMDAYETAKGAVMAVNKDDHGEGLYAAGVSARDAAKRAYEDASAASGDAAAATTVAVAAAQRDIAQSRQQEAETQRDEAVRVGDVASALDVAKSYYMAAAEHATNAEKEADAAEMLGPDTPQAQSARDAATDAREAATNAEKAYEGIMDEMTKEEADKQAGKAKDEAGEAESHYETAKAEHRSLAGSAGVFDERNREIKVGDATTAAKKAAMAARGAATAARTDATAARRAAVAAKASYDKAMAARTDMEKAKEQYMAADAAATKAETAAGNAEMAASGAENAHMNIDEAGSIDDAERAQETAETKQGDAEMARGTAMTEYGTAMTARDSAAMAADTHVLSLFLAANGAHVEDVATTPTTDEMAAHVKSVGTAMMAIADADSGNQAAGTTATINFPGDTMDNPTTEDTDESSEGMLGITVNVAGTVPIEAELRESKDAVDLNNDGDFTGEGENLRIIQTAKEIADLGDFQGYELWEDDGNANTGDFTDRARAIVFTNKVKGKDSVLEVTAATARAVVDQAVTSSELSNVRSTAGRITDVTWTPSGEAPLTGTLSCESGCDIDLGDDGAVNEISGYTFTGSREAREAVAAADAADNNDYLAFGLWLEESDDGTTDTFGAFAVGGTGYAVNVQNATVGTATYTGNAAGAHHKTGEGVNWFHGDASLTAKFGAADVAGTVSGMISNIRVNGGDAMSTPIYLGQADLTDGTATFNGAAFMGDATAPGAATHEFDGTWSGSFFGATMEDSETTALEAITAPKAAAGTFGVTKSMGTGSDMVTESFVGAFGAHKQ